MDILAKAQQELADIEKRRAELQEFITLGAKLFSVQQTSLIAKETTASHGNSFKAKVTNIADEALSDGTTKTTKEIIGLLKANGVEITGANPVITVSTILSRQKDKFKSDRGVGWSKA